MKPAGHKVARGASLPADAGTIFVESVIAAAIVAMALMAMLQVVADSAVRERGLEQRRTALLVAQSQLAAVGSEIPLKAGPYDGVAGGMLWHVDISPYSDGLDSGAVGRLLFIAVSVKARAGGGTLAQLDTIRLGPQL
ncbi:MAG: hypothetical protein JO303_19170 [Caulobacteraceae bacterium]|nr:hypothetical protein [Caulobacteraceae bacterium]